MHQRRRGQRGASAVAIRSMRPSAACGIVAAPWPAVTTFYRSSDCAEDRWRRAAAAGIPGRTSFGFYQAGAAGLVGQRPSTFCLETVSE
ncbi:hypothetical protein NDU88_007511 [Pleurodeles waltl]|uniref:Uncharacterized protein n=1 Tax=Pleurodeles waltl TaxID=8319 RepID=A0AAV7RV00_PLEWA|nr:hypothetical protein NDU88_007511 [Pleurodeles waltl]